MGLHGCIMCMYACINSKTRGSGGMLPQKKSDALRLLLRPFWNRSRIVVATWLAEYCIKFLMVHVHLLSLELLQKKVLQLAEQSDEEDELYEEV